MYSDNSPSHCCYSHCPTHPRSPPLRHSDRPSLPDSVNSPQSSQKPLDTLSRTFPHRVSAQRGWSVVPQAQSAWVQIYRGWWTGALGTRGKGRRRRKESVLCPVSFDSRYWLAFEEEDPRRDEIDLERCEGGEGDTYHRLISSFLPFLHSHGLITNAMNG